MDVQTVALFVQNFLYARPGQASRQARKLLEAMLGAINANSDRMELARTRTAWRRSGSSTPWGCRP